MQRTQNLPAKSPALDRFRSKVQADEPVYGLWITLEAAAVSDIAAGLGLDWVVIDDGAGYLDRGEVREHVRASARSNTVVLIYQTDLSPESIERVLYSGADGIVAGNVESANQLQSIVRTARRVWKNLRADISKDGAREQSLGSLIAPVIGSAADCNFADLLSVEGVEVFFCRPEDLAEYDRSIDDPERAALIARYGAVARDARLYKKQAGGIALTESSLAIYQEAGFRVLGLGVDSEIIHGKIRGLLDLLNEPSAPQQSSSFGQQGKYKAGVTAKQREPRI